MTRGLPKAIHTKSLDAFYEIQDEGIIDEMKGIALNLVENNPGLTARELLDVGIMEGYYTDRDVGQIQKRLSDLKNEGKIIVPEFRKCSVTNRTVSVYERNYGIRDGVLSKAQRKKPKYPPIEFPSLTEGEGNHTVIYWDDGEVQSTSKGYEMHGYDRGSIGAKIIFGGVESLTDTEKDYLMRKIKKRADWCEVYVEGNEEDPDEAINRLG